MQMERKSWEEFRASGLLWFVNRLLHVFGYAIVLEYDDEDEHVTDCYPARVSYRGFSENVEEQGYLAVSKLIKDLAPQLVEEASDITPPAATAKEPDADSKA